MGLIFKKPERKVDSFLVPIRNSDNARLRLRLTEGVVLEKVLRVRDQDAHVIQCRTHDAVLIEQLAQYDQEVLDHVLAHCNTWFHTELSEEKIREMFLPSLGAYREIRALVSSVLEPKVMLNHNILSGFCDLLPSLECRRDLSPLHVLVEIEAQGIYIRAKRFGIRWIVKDLRIVEEEFQKADNPFDMGTRLDVHDGLDEDLAEVERSVRREVGELQQKIRNLEEFVQTARRTLSDIRNIGKEAEEEWADRANSLSKMLWSYQRVRWNEN